MTTRVQAWYANSSKSFLTLVRENLTEFNVRVDYLLVLLTAIASSNVQTVYFLLRGSLLALWKPTVTKMLCTFKDSIFLNVVNVNKRLIIHIWKQNFHKISLARTFNAKENFFEPSEVKLMINVILWKRVFYFSYLFLSTSMSILLFLYQYKTKRRQYGLLTHALFHFV